MNRIVDISQDNQHLSKSHGFMLVTSKKEEVGRVALDEILAVMVHAHGTTYSNNILAEFAKRCIILVICDSSHAPVAWLWPAKGHHHQLRRMSAQTEAPLPLKKRLWQQVVIQKITMQARILETFAGNASAAKLKALAQKVKSGDGDNYEAQAARLYWPALMGEEFRRDQDLDGINALLNYGYAVLRAAVARYIMAAGLHPSLGIHHCHQYNAFSLADDLMEPFRPIVDAAVKNLAVAEKTAVDPENKTILAGLLTMDCTTQSRRSPLITCMETFVYSLVLSYQHKKAQLTFPILPQNSEVLAIGGDGAKKA